MSGLKTHINQSVVACVDHGEAVGDEVYGG